MNTSAKRIEEIYKSTTDYDQDDEVSRLSVVSERSNRSQKVHSTDSLREKLLLQTNPYTFEMAKAIIGTSCRGLTSEAATQRGKAVFENLRTIGINLVQQRDKESEALNGRILVDTVTSMIAQCGEPMVAVVKTNLDLRDFIDEVKESIQDLEERILEKESSIKAPNMFNTEYVNLKFDVQVEDRISCQNNCRIPCEL